MKKQLSKTSLIEGKKKFLRLKTFQYKPLLEIFIFKRAEKRASQE